MAKSHSPRHGSMQFWPRKRARRIYPRIRNWADNEKGLQGFFGYKAGMTHIIAIDNRKNSPTKGQEIMLPVTVIEAPPMELIGAKIYKLDVEGYKTLKTLIFKKPQHLERKIKIKKLHKIEELDNIKGDDIKAIVATSPYLTGIGKKKPDIIEISLGNASYEEKVALIKELANKKIYPQDIFKPGQLVDVHAVTKGKGTQGPVKRFGISLRSHKSEKTIRGPGSLGPWNAQGKIMWRVAKAGQTGYHTRTEYNKKFIGVFNPEEINPKGGFVRYGLLRNPAILLFGSVPGPAKRGVIITQPIRPPKKAWLDPVEIKYIDTTSNQS